MAQQSQHPFLPYVIVDGLKEIGTKPYVETRQILYHSNSFRPRAIMRIQTHCLQITGIPAMFIFLRLSENDDVEPDRMVGGERTRAYRYGMTLLCVGALFNWLGFSNSQSDPVRFIGYTCLASGALLLCMALCFWANSVQRPPNNQIRPESNDFTVVNILDAQHERYACEKPPDYNSVADLSPPPSYDDAIRLSPAYLPSQMGQCSGIGRMISDEPAPVHVASSSPATQSASQIPAGPKPENSSETSSPSDSPKTTVESPKNDSSALSRVIRLSSRLLRRTLSNVDDQPETSQSASRTIQRSRSDQDVKRMEHSSASPI